MKTKNLEVVKEKAATLKDETKKTENKLNNMNKRNINHVLADQNGQDIVAQSQQLKQLKNEVNENHRIIH